eukprot:TRINITY_DN47929_c0_g1_i1.p1 TRINITY_DN47929_c0_g1~~TRINITY_DN47929_c0_g1_i1.p1  ORF type:complete len:753 (+),score=146.16 TRINITY_DN47929_c0_g1_i1:96-2354(+)
MAPTWCLLHSCLVLAISAGALAAGKKPLFEYDDHYVMLNDFGRNEFYQRALNIAVPECGKSCTVLDVGTGSGLLSMMAAQAGADQVFAIEANPDLAELAVKTIAANQGTYPNTNVTVAANLSSQVDLSWLPHSQRADLLVTETFGTMLLGEGCMNFVPDARDRLLKEGGTIIPAGGCQHVTLVEVSELAAATSPADWNGLNLSNLEMLSDRLYHKATVGASKPQYKRLSDRICVLEIDLYKDTAESVPKNRTFHIQAKSSGRIHAAMFDWDIWSDLKRTEVLSTAQGSRNFAGDVAWGWLLQSQEEAGPDWKFHPKPKPVDVKAGDWLEMSVEFIARGISMHVRVRPAGPPSSPAEVATSEVRMAGGRDGTVPEAVGAPSRMFKAERHVMKEANEYYLPVAGDAGRHDFYSSGLDAAVAKLGDKKKGSTILDVSGNAGVPAFMAAREHQMKVLAMPRANHMATIIREMAVWNEVGSLVEVFAGDPREMFDVLMPDSKKAHIAVVEPPGTPLHGLSPFAVLPSIRKELLEQDGLVVPGAACLEVGLVESIDLAYMFSVPGPTAKWDRIDLQVWNKEAREKGVLTRLVPYTKWLSQQSTMRHRWLSEPTCVFEVDLNAYSKVPTIDEQLLVRGLEVTSDGQAHAVVGRWAVWKEKVGEGEKLSAESDYAGRGLTWPHYVQAVATPGTGPGFIEPLEVKAGQEKQLEIFVRQGIAKITGSAGPEFTLRLFGADDGNGTAYEGRDNFEKMQKKQEL